MTNLPSDIIFKGMFLILFAFLFLDNKRMKEQNERLGKDISGLSVALQTSVDTTRNGFGQMRAATATIVLSQEQANKILRGEIASIKDKWNVKINGIRSYSQVGTRYLFPIAVPGRDTIIYNNREVVYHTPQGTLYTSGDSLVGTLSISDTVRIIVSKGKREKWWKIWERRPLVTNAFMARPDGSITSLKSVLSE